MYDKHMAVRIIVLISIMILISQMVDQGKKVCLAQLKNMKYDVYAIWIDVQL